VVLQAARWSHDAPAIGPHGEWQVDSVPAEGAFTNGKLGIGRVEPTQGREASERGTVFAFRLVQLKNNGTGNSPRWRSPTRCVSRRSRINCDSTVPTHGAAGIGSTPVWDQLIRRIVPRDQRRRAFFRLAFLAFLVRVAFLAFLALATFLVFLRVGALPAEIFGPPFCASSTNS
jgi:hypothetical protein